jgi:hypothetical protein
VVHKRTRRLIFVKYFAHALLQSCNEYSGTAGECGGDEANELYSCMCSAHVQMSRDIYWIQEQLERLGETNQDNYSSKCFAHAQMSRVWIVHVVEKNQNILEKFSAHG